MTNTNTPTSDLRRSAIVAAADRLAQASVTRDRANAALNAITAKHAYAYAEYTADPEFLAAHCAAEKSYSEFHGALQALLNFYPADNN